jgi:hypothetical protein
VEGAVVAAVETIEELAMAGLESKLRLSRREEERCV